MPFPMKNLRCEKGMMKKEVDWKMLLPEKFNKNIGIGNIE
jgi:hypothetical protein